VPTRSAPLKNGLRAARIGALCRPPVAQSDIDFVHAHTKPGDKIGTTDDPFLYSPTEGAAT